jgi:thymidylate kinase
MDFQHKVDNAYLHIAKDFGIPTVDASPSIEEIQASLIKLFGL